MEDRAEMLMEDRAEILRRRIEAHRCYLSVGADLAIVRVFLSQIAADEAELALIEMRNKKPEPPAGEA
jgi:hypothetical protein